MTKEEKYRIRDELFNCLHEHKRSLDKADRYADYGMGFSEAMKIVAMYLFDDDKPQTNYDLIISKTPDELAEWLKAIVQTMSLPIAFVNGELIENWLDWLKQEVTDA